MSLVWQAFIAPGAAGGKWVRESGWTFANRTDCNFTGNAPDMPPRTPRHPSNFPAKCGRGAKPALPERLHARLRACNAPSRVPTPSWLNGEAQKSCHAHRSGLRCCCGCCRRNGRHALRQSVSPAVSGEWRDTCLVAVAQRVLTGKRLARGVGTDRRESETAALQELDRFFGAAAQAIKSNGEHANFIHRFRGKFRD